ncbi:MAG: PIG-L family deacetylase [Weeksellaceae bacterium]
MLESKNKKVLALAPHADDIEIGMGGSIARLVQNGYEVKIINLIIPCEDVFGKSSETAKKIRMAESVKSAEIMGVEMETLDLNPYNFGYNRETTKLFDQIIRDFDPGHVFMTWEHDSHQDHQALAKIVYGATRKNRCSVYMYETMIPGGISTYAFRPQMFINISDHIDQKKQSIDAYKSVFGNNSIAEAIIGRASFRGSQIGVKYAEAFEIVKEIIY